MTTASDTATVAVVIERAENPLPATDRCDVCGAQAYVQAMFDSGPLLFCAHDYTKRITILKEQAVMIYDYTQALSN